MGSLAVQLLFFFSSHYFCYLMPFLLRVATQGRACAFVPSPECLRKFAILALCVSHLSLCLGCAREDTWLGVLRHLLEGVLPACRGGQRGPGGKRKKAGAGRAQRERGERKREDR